MLFASFYAEAPDVIEMKSYFLLPQILVFPKKVFGQRERRGRKVFGQRGGWRGKGH